MRWTTRNALGELVTELDYPENPDKCADCGEKCYRVGGRWECQKEIEDECHVQHCR
jgi:hypothetical protein